MRPFIFGCVVVGTLAFWQGYSHASTFGDTPVGLGVAASDTAYVNVTGDTMTNSLVMSGVTTDFTTVGNEDLTLDPAGTGQVRLPGTQKLSFGDTLTLALESSTTLVVEDSGGNNLFAVANTGAVTSYGAISAGLVGTAAVMGSKFNTGANCIDIAGDAACDGANGGASAGMVVVDAGDSTTVVTTAAASGVNSEIHVWNCAYADARYDSIGATTCNTARLVFPEVSSAAAGSFTITTYAYATGSVLAPSANPLCVCYTITN